VHTAECNLLLFLICMDDFIIIISSSVETTNNNKICTAARWKVENCEMHFAKLKKTVVFFLYLLKFLSNV
jgi:hypothetical protein